MMKKDRKHIHKAELIALCAMLTSLVAMSIDSMLPALQIMGQELGVLAENDNQLVVSVLFSGFAIGQLFMGPLSDSIGRKLAIFFGLGLFLFGSILCVTAESFETMLWGRFIQGLGVAGPRIVTMALIRDLYEGRGMAQIMSFIMAVFIIVPALAPSVGQAILAVAEWRWIFLTLIIMAAIGFIWLLTRQPETLDKEKRLPFSPKQIWTGIKETCATRASFGYTIAAGIIFGAFIGYLSSAQQIFQDVYDAGENFPIYFGVLALAIGAASLVNGKLVVKYGMRNLLIKALMAKIVICFAFLPFVLFAEGRPDLLYFMIWGMSAFFCTGILFGNFNALALEPLGHIAGIASSVIGALSTLISIFLGYAVGNAYDFNVTPLVAGFGFLSLLGLFVVYWTERKL
ncbi:multidrug effflux MFS transporter [Curvivirga aplysinae]|uniref:multidrug effflux MFS transporter n=1 Tax=Curvivirga aplysinae TaxID=2529852 RepID=UPI0012BC2F6D|nr:multidrug effflux MFS transporter [Curvivirga aplysinae]MTI09834.1 MFS transporter [Curvivirga aplysinae]